MGSNSCTIMFFFLKELNLKETFSSCLCFQKKERKEKFWVLFHDGSSFLSHPILSWGQTIWVSFRSFRSFEFLKTNQNSSKPWMTLHLITVPVESNKLLRFFYLERRDLFVLFLYARKFFSLQKHSFSVWSHLRGHEEFVPVFLVGRFPRSRELDFIPQHGVAWKQEHHRARLHAVSDCTVTQQTGESTLTARPQHVLCMIAFYYIVAIISY